MDTDLEKKINDMAEKVEVIYQSVEKTRKYFLVMLWITILLVVLPGIGLFFAIPSFVNTYSTGLEGLL